MNVLDTIPLAEIPYGIAKPIALIGCSVNDLENRTNLRFVNGYDDLDDFLGTGFRTPTGRVVGLRGYRRTPVSGIEILIPEDSADIKDALYEALICLQIKDTELKWYNPNAE